MTSIGQVLFGLVFVVVGVSVGGYAVYDGYYQVQEVNSAVEPTEGTILASEITSSNEVDEGETETEYYPRISYEYTVDGQTYRGERIYSKLDRKQEEGELAGKEYDSRSRAREVADRYPAGATVTVYHYSDSPAKSFLVKPSPRWPFVLFGGVFGGVFALAGIGAMFAED